ncbi:Holliday junction branch migration protein RuvA [Liquorilactobacillus vini]|uniref:Holliday junction branch migration complex subunit RuvA n=3 Tax=Liquorilactobacillus vini TaxID=238015 RepID=A0A0R2CAN2_9LACO|nr:Holliday junction branch migration protein RuvA [Liquorilactobacillus vini]KRM88878.1 holliday junction dna helicase ruva [Liquorilactobacillus vini DSM 20605]
MYDYLIGKITDINPAYIVIEVGGIGFLVYAANPFKFKIGQEQKVFIYQAVRENDISLYGFQTNAEKKLFIKLLNVSGIGPKSALAILATDDFNGLITAISSNNISYLIKFPGVGKKTAQQIVLDLKGKLAPNTVQTSLTPASEIGSNLLQEALAALAALGYTRNEINKITPKLEQASAQTTDEYLRLGLKLLMKN